VSDTPSTVLLQAEAASPVNDYSFFVMMGMIFLIFYVLVMRPQQRKQKEHEAAIKAATKGDRVVTNGGLHGIVSEVSDETFKIEVARVKGGAKVEVEVSRSGISSVVKDSKDVKNKDVKNKDEKKEGSEGS
jgi:preprotein translocase subunit YajC